MLTRGFLILIFLMSLGLSVTHAEILTIDTEPPELIKLRQSYEAEKKEAASPNSLLKIQQKLEKARRDAVSSKAHLTKKTELETARNLEIRKITEKYQAKLDQLERNAIAAVDAKYKNEMANFQANSIKQVHSNHLINLERLEKALIKKSDLAGALVVQTERKRIAIEPVTVMAPGRPAPKISSPKIATPPAPPVALASTNSRQASAAKPFKYVNSSHGVAGASGNVSKNIYSFAIKEFGKNSELIFHAFGKRSNDSHGDVYLITPNGKRRKVANWSPKNLEATNFFGVQAAKDVRPVKTDISKYVTSSGKHQVEFRYKNGNEALNIFQVTINSW